MLLLVKKKKKIFFKAHEKGLFATLSQKQNCEERNYTVGDVDSNTSRETMQTNSDSETPPDSGKQG